MRKTRYIYKKARQMKNRGVKRSLQSLMSAIQDWWFDYKLGVRTEEIVPLKNLGIQLDDRVDKKKNRRYQATRVRAFRKLMNRLTLPKENVFVDLGSGMGRMLLLAMEYGFKKAVGVEFSGYLCQIAQSNIDIYQKKHRTRTQVEVIKSDVADYEVQDDETVYFLFNPFNDNVMGILFQKIRKSLQRNDREIWIIYHNPVHHEVLNALDYMETFCTFVYGGSHFYIYKHGVLVKNLETAET